MKGFCPDDWHGTTETDLQQMSWGEDFWLYADARMLGFSSAQPSQRREYAIHDAAIAQARREGLDFHTLSDAEQSARMDEAEAALSRVSGGV